MKPILTEFKGATGKSTVIVGDYNVHLLVVDKTREKGILIHLDWPSAGG